MDRRLRAANLLALALILLSFGSTLFAGSIASYLFWTGLLVMSTEAFTRWILEDLGKIEPPPIHPRAKRLFRLSSPRFWSFPVIVLGQAWGLGVSVAILVSLTLLHVWSSRWTAQSPD